MESKFTVEESANLINGRRVKRHALGPAMGTARVRAFAPASASGPTNAAGPAPTAAETASPTKDLDAIVIANTLVGYGENISLENMAIIENIIKFSKLEANFEVPDGKPEAWYLSFLQCMDELGCFVADSGYTSYQKNAQQLTMDNIVVDIVKAGIGAAKAAIPGASALSAIVDTTLDSLKTEAEAINLFHHEVTQSKGVKLAIMPCDQLANGIILTSLSSIDSVGGEEETSPLFFDWKTTSRTIFRGSSYITFNPVRYAGIKNDLEEYLGEHFKAALSKRFERRKKKNQ